MPWSLFTIPAPPSVNSFLDKERAVYFSFNISQNLLFILLTSYLCPWLPNKQLDYFYKLYQKKKEKK